jgi:hypothetical protein
MTKFIGMYIFVNTLETENVVCIFMFSVNLHDMVKGYRDMNGSFLFFLIVNIEIICKSENIQILLTICKPALTRGALRLLL